MNEIKKKQEFNGIDKGDAWRKLWQVIQTILSLGLNHLFNYLINRKK